MSRKSVTSITRPTQGPAASTGGTPARGSKLSTGVVGAGVSKGAKSTGRSKEIARPVTKASNVTRKSIASAAKPTQRSATTTRGALTRGSKLSTGAVGVGVSKGTKSTARPAEIARPVAKASNVTRKSVPSARGSIQQRPDAGRGAFARQSKPGAGLARPVTGDRSKAATSRREISVRPEKGTRTSRTGTETGTSPLLRSDSRKSIRELSPSVRQARQSSERARQAAHKSQQIRTENIRSISASRPAVSRSSKVPVLGDRHRPSRLTAPTRVYRERSTVVRDIHPYEHVYMDHRDRVCRTRVWPTYRFLLCYNWGPWRTWRYFYPYYHRRYMFVSLGGYWPVDYGYRRYYWYGCHPYRWYGYYPIAREIQHPMYNYYTYNYYYAGNGTVAEPAVAAYDVAPVDHTTFADVREKLAAQATQAPLSETLADRYFEDAVKAFELGDYNRAADLLAKAMVLAPDDMILPFAYCQALFAAERYTEAAEALRQALAKFEPEKQDAFFPRGLYPDEDTLFEQIDQLAEKVNLYSFDADLQLLLGYQLLGIGELDTAVEPLRLASRDLENASSATILLNLLEKIRIEEPADSD